MNRSTIALAVCGVTVACHVVSAQGIGGGLQNRPDPAQVQQKIQEQTQQRIQAQAEAQAQARAQSQAQQAVERVQQRLETQAQNQAARVESQAARMSDAMRQRTEAQANAAVDRRSGQRGLQAEIRTQTQAEIATSPSFFERWNPFRGKASPDRSATAASQNESGTRSLPMQARSASKEESDGEDARPSSNGLRVGQQTELRGTARAELARSMTLQLAAISAMRDRAIESEDVALLERADRLEGAVRRALDARAEGRVDAESEALVKAELPAVSVGTEADSQTSVQDTSELQQP